MSTGTFKLKSELEPKLFESRGAGAETNNFDSATLLSIWLQSPPLLTHFCGYIILIFSVYPFVNFLKEIFPFLFLTSQIVLPDRQPIFLSKFLICLRGE